MIVDRTRRYIRYHGLIRQGNLVLVGVSGGPDSLFLLLALSQIIPDLEGRLHVLHLDHGLRKESAADAAFVEELASSMNLSCTIERRPVVRETSSKISPQERARKVRLSFFREAKDRLGADCIALGHTADDHAETIILRLIAGGGPAALSGIHPRGPYGIIHPLLKITKKEILEYLHRQGREFRVDQSNLTDRYLRNRIRNKIMPEILEINPAFLQRVSTLGPILYDEDKYLEAEAVKTLSGALSRKEGNLCLYLKALSKVPRPLLRRILLMASRESGVPTKKMNIGHVRALLKLLRGQVGKGIDLPGGVRAMKNYQQLVFSAESRKSPVLFERVVALPGSTTLPELGLTVETVLASPPGGALGSDLMTTFINEDKLRGELLVRTRRPGDCFIPLGFGHRQKLKDYFINIKLSQPDRDLVPIFCDREKIIWVGGFRLDDRSKVTAGAKKVWRITLTREGEETCRKSFPNL